MQQQKELICDLGMRLWQKGFVAANDGNLSVRLGENRFLITPSGVSKGALRPDMLLLVDASGTLLEPSPYRPSSEVRMHLTCYQVRQDVFAVVHAHPPAATAFACARMPINQRILGEALMTLGDVPVAPYGRTGTEEIPAAIKSLLPGHSGILLSNHGALTMGKNLTEAYHQMERLEQTAQITLYTRLLGGGVPLSQDEAAALRELGI